jgi:RNA polymerase sigma-70 factor (ECF subfamily)
MESSPQALEEIEWVKRVQKGDRAAFGPLVERYERRVRSLVFRLVRRRDEAEDITQDIFVKAFRGIRSYNFQASFGTWLMRVAANHCYDYLRHESKARVSYFWQMSEESSRALEDGAESPLKRGEAIEQELSARDLVGKLMARAPAQDRVILALKEMEDYSVEEISKILNLKVNTVKVRLHRARRRMLGDLRRWGQGR